MRATAIAKIVCLSSILWLLVGCSSRLVSGLAEVEANEIVSILSGAGVDAQKQSADGKTHEVMVSGAAFNESLQILRSVGLPKERTTKLPDYIKKEGLVSTPLEERARLMYALGRDMAQTFEQIDGVIQARVHVVVPTVDSLGEKPRASSASVFIRHRPGLDTAQFSPKVKQLVLNGIEGLSYDRITVSLFEADVLNVPKSTASAVARRPIGVGWWIGSFAALLSLLALTIWLGRDSLMRRLGQLFNKQSITVDEPTKPPSNNRFQTLLKTNPFNRMNK